MKKSIKYILLGLIGLGAFSCNDILTENPVSLTTADSYYSTPKGLEDGLKSAYSPLRSFYGQEQGFYLTETGTDIFTYGVGGVSNKPYINDYSANFLGTDAFITKVWEVFYVGINQCNAIIGRAPKTEGITSAVRNRIIGEARFLRALYYFHLVQQYGDVHFTLEETIGVETTANRTPVSKIYNEGIIPDLQFAVDNLPATTSDYGRATKPAALALLARVQLTVGNWQQAEQLAQTVITDNNFQLIKPYVNLWNINNVRNSEIIWAVQFTADPLTNGSGNQAHLFFTPDYARCPAVVRDLENGRNFVRFMPTNFMLKLYDQKNDSRWAGSFKTVWIANKATKINNKNVVPGDTAMKMVTYPVPDNIQSTAPYWYIDFNDKWVGKAGDKEIGGLDRRLFPNLIKHMDPLRSSVNATDGRRDVPVIRKAEMYLIAAEAAWKQNKVDAAASYINVLRNRAALPGKEQSMVVTPAQINLDFILDERARELAGEMHRWYDLKRTGKLIERVKLYNLDATPNIKEMHLVRPIPQTQIDRITNPAEFIQNQGY